MTIDTVPLLPDAEPAKKVARLPQAYIGAWLVLGLSSTIYLAALAVRPDILVAGGHHRGLASPEANAAQSWLSPSLVTFANLQRSIDMLAGDVATLKTTGEEFDAREKALVMRVGSIESRLSGIAATAVPVKLPVQAVPTPAVVAQAAIPPPDTVKQMRLIATAPVPFQTKVSRDPGKAEPPATAVATIIETGSLPALRLPAPVAAPAAAPRRTVGVLLATGPSVESLRLSWSLLTDRHKASFQALEPRYIGNDSTSYQLLAGPITSESDAQKLCQSLKARGVACKPVEFAGEGL